MKKQKITLLLIAFAFIGQLAVAQVLITDDPATNTSANPNSILDLKSESKPLLLPVLPITQLPSTANSAYGMLCVTTGNTLFDDPAFHNLEFHLDPDTDPGNNNDVWVRIIHSNLGISALADVRRTGATGTSYYIGEGTASTTGTSKRWNTVIGFEAGNVLNSERNTFVGYRSGYLATDPGGAGQGQNTAIGELSAYNLTTGVDNTFVGAGAQPAAGQGGINHSTAVGAGAETTGDFSTAIGFLAKTNGTNSTALGANAQTTGPNQVVLGTSAETVIVPGRATIDDFLKLTPKSDAPASPTAGTIYYDSDDNKVKVWTGAAWEDLN